MALINKLEAIGDAIRNKTGQSDLLTLDEMPAAIEGIQTGNSSNGIDVSNLGLIIEAPASLASQQSLERNLPIGWKSTEISYQTIKYERGTTTMLQGTSFDYLHTGFQKIPDVDIDKILLIDFKMSNINYVWTKGMSYSYNQGYYLFDVISFTYSSKLQLNCSDNNSYTKVGIDLKNKVIISTNTIDDVGYTMIYEKGEND